VPGVRCTAARLSTALQNNEVSVKNHEVRPRIQVLRGVSKGGETRFCYAHVAHSFVHRQPIAMFWRKPPLHIPKQHEQVSSDETEQLRNRVHRLEIDSKELRDRVDALEGRLASLSASVRGRLGGRPNRATGLGNFAVPLPINHLER